MAEQIRSGGEPEGGAGSQLEELQRRREREGAALKGGRMEKKKTSQTDEIKLPVLQMDQFHIHLFPSELRLAGS